MTSCAKTSNVGEKMDVCVETQKVYQCKKKVSQDCVFRPLFDGISLFFYLVLLSSEI